jgi:curved DNA-binding protein CbpA
MPRLEDSAAVTKKIDYYEFLQISPNADQDTIHRIYRFLAARYHPDNPKSGNADTFATLTTAYDALSDPDRRAEYDLERANDGPATPPLSAKVDFMDHLEGETNRRLAVLAVLYYRRRTNAQSPEVSLTEIENRMGFPRDYLDFTTWYLLRKGYVVRADNSDFTLTAQGVDFVETQRVNIPILNKLLTNGEAGPEDAPNGATRSASSTASNGAMHGSTNGAANGKKQPALVTPHPDALGVVLAEERRLAGKDRRNSPPDRRKTAADRRVHAQLTSG